MAVKGIGSTITPIAMKVLSIFLILALVLFIAAILVGIVWVVMRRRTYNRDIVILRQKQNGGYTIEFDKGGYFKNRNKDWKFRLKKNKTWLEGRYDYDITRESGGNVNFLFRDTADNFYHIRPELFLPMKYALDKNKNKIPMTDADGNTIFDTSGNPKYIKMVNLGLKVTAEDVEWAKNAYSEYTMTYSRKSTFEKYFPLIGMGMFVALVIVLFALLMQKFDIIQGAAQALVEASKNIAAAKSGAMPSVAPT